MTISLFLFLAGCAGSAGSVQVEGIDPFGTVVSAVWFSWGYGEHQITLTSESGVCEKYQATLASTGDVSSLFNEGHWATFHLEDHRNDSDLNEDLNEGRFEVAATEAWEDIPSRELQGWVTYPDDSFFNLSDGTLEITDVLEEETATGKLMDGELTDGSGIHAGGIEASFTATYCETVRL